MSDPSHHHAVPASLEDDNFSSDQMKKQYASRLGSSTL